MPPASSLSKLVLRLSSKSMDKQVQNQETDSIVVGKGLDATWKVQDKTVDAVYGTFERTVNLGVWVYCDHSQSGSLLNDTQSVHNDAVVVHDGDRLKIGQTEITMRMESKKSEAGPEEEEDKKVVGLKQGVQWNAHRVPTCRASTPTNGLTKAQQVKRRLPRIKTSSLGVTGLSSSIASESMTTPPEYTSSPIAGVRWPTEIFCVATTTPASPSPLFERHGSSQSFKQTFGQDSDMLSKSQRQEVEVKTSSKTSCPPPLEYSSSPTVSPSFLTARQRHIIPQRSLVDASSPTFTSAAGKMQTIRPGARPHSRCDNLRIQVSKKMAAAAPAGSRRKYDMPHGVPKTIEFQAPASPVAQQDILRQKESLQIILQHKIKEEQLLKQQQEEWMRQNLMSKDNEVASESSTATGFNERADVSRCYVVEDYCENTARVPRPDTKLKRTEENDTLSKENHELRCSDESVISTASTMITCHRRVTSSLSSGCTSSVDLCSFLGYEEDERVKDTVTSYTTPDLYWSAELLGHSREETSLMSDTATPA
ncbi:hypothetical protein PsorP6_012461 [Peronosclerospora sorghi]|uniref:Uncharacterized protein n=1 Tax=Peronosclerospora sorghi TaxID=230839 RepID=A0ACC0WID8_9STRA|nr:hypothetical protein PsorP6_012461 [Peronosclerospora sorghi]